MLREELAVQERSTLWVGGGGGGGGGCTPFPVRLKVPTAPELPIAVTVALAAPAPDGVNVMVPFAVWPALRVNGSDTPLTEKVGAFTESWVTVTLEPPLLDMEM